MAKNEKDPINIFGSMENAKKEIMKHWRAANIRDDEKRINVKLMKSRDFMYPLSINGLKACVSAELQGGQAAHWDYYDLVQTSHLSDARNIGDRDVLIDLAKTSALDLDKFIKDFDSKEVLDKIESDIKLARKLRVNSVPTLIINKKIKVPGAINYEELKELMINELA